MHVSSKYLMLKEALSLAYTFKIMLDSTKNRKINRLLKLLSAVQQNKQTIFIGNKLMVYWAYLLIELIPWKKFYKNIFLHQNKSKK